MTRLPRAQRREQLIESARSVFASRGYSGATTAELARTAGVTEPILYRHFNSKKELFIAVIQHAGAQTIEQWNRQLRAGRSAAQRLRRLIGANPMIRSGGRGIYRVISQAMMEIEDPDILAALQAHVASLHRFVSAEVARAQEEGTVSRAFSPEVTAWTLMHLGLGYGVLAPLSLPGHAEDDSGVRVRDLIERLMLGPSAKGT